MFLSELSTLGVIIATSLNILLPMFHSDTDQTVLGGGNVQHLSSDPASSNDPRSPIAGHPIRSSLWQNSTSIREKLEPMSRTEGETPASRSLSLRHPYDSPTSDSPYPLSAYGSLHGNPSTSLGSTNIPSRVPSASFSVPGHSRDVASEETSDSSLPPRPYSISAETSGSRASAPPTTGSASRDLPSSSDVASSKSSKGIRVSASEVFVGEGPSVKKRPRRRYDEIERLYSCNWGDCTKAYGTLNHLNAHIVTQGHGQKREPNEFRDVRKAWRNRNREGRGGADIPPSLAYSITDAHSVSAADDSPSPSASRRTVSPTSWDSEVVGSLPQAEPVSRRTTAELTRLNIPSLPAPPSYSPRQDHSAGPVSAPAHLSYRPWNKITSQGPLQPTLHQGINNAAPYPVTVQYESGFGAARLQPQRSHDSLYLGDFGQQSGLYYQQPADMGSSIHSVTQNDIPSTSVPSASGHQYPTYYNPDPHKQPDAPTSFGASDHRPPMNEWGQYPQMHPAQRTAVYDPSVSHPVYYQEPVSRESFSREYSAHGDPRIEHEALNGATYSSNAFAAHDGSRLHDSTLHNVTPSSAQLPPVYTPSNPSFQYSSSSPSSMTTGPLDPNSTLLTPANLAPPTTLQPYYSPNM